MFNIKDKTKFDHRNDVIYLGHVLKQQVMIITLLKQNDEFSRGLKTTTTYTLNHTLKNYHQHVSKKDFKIIRNGF